MQPKPLIIGYGNPLRGDDGFGWEAVSRLEIRSGLDADLVCSHQLTPELAEPISQASLVVFLDAAATGEPGEIHCQSVWPAAPQDSAFSHDFDAPELLLLARMLYGQAPPAVLISVAGRSFELEEKLSVSILEALPRVLELVDTIVAAAPVTTGDPAAEEAHYA